MKIIAAIIIALSSASGDISDQYARDERRGTIVTEM